MLLLKKKREKDFLFSPSFDFRCNREETLLRVEEWKGRKWVKCKWTPPPNHHHCIGYTGTIWSLDIKTSVPIPAQRDAGEPFHDPFMPSWNSSKVFWIISMGGSMMLLQLLSCIIREVHWSHVSKLEMLSFRCHWIKLLMWSAVERTTILSVIVPYEKQSLAEKNGSGSVPVITLISHTQHIKAEACYNSMYSGLNNNKKQLLIRILWSIWFYLWILKWFKCN